MEELFEFLKKAGVWFLATEEQGQPHVRPIGTQLIYNGKLYFQTGLKKKMSQQLLKIRKLRSQLFRVIDGSASKQKPFLIRMKMSKRPC